MITRPVMLRCVSVEEISKAEPADRQEYRAKLRADHNDLLVELTVVSGSACWFVGQNYELQLTPQSSPTRLKGTP